jgi:hypothetical protein
MSSLCIFLFLNPLHVQDLVSSIKQYFAVNSVPSYIPLYTMSDETYEVPIMLSPEYDPRVRWKMPLC